MYNGTKAALSILALLIGTVVAFPAPVLATTGTLTITGNTTLAEDHFGDIDVVTDGVVLDCAGHSVTGAGSGTGIDLTGRTGVTVQNCRVTQFQFGFLLLLVGGNTLTKNTASTNDIGFQITRSSSNILTKNTATGALSGFSFFMSSGNTLTANTANGNVLNGFQLSTAFNDNILKGNTASGNGFDGFAGVPPASQNIFTGNTASGNGRSGFNLPGFDNTTLTKNTANGNRLGFSFGSANDNTLTKNTANGNSQVGFGLSADSRNSVTKNTADGNGQFGFVIQSSSNDNTITKNAACGNGIVDALQLGSTGNVFAGNRFCDTLGI